MHRTTYIGELTFKNNLVCKYLQYFSDVFTNLWVPQLSANTKTFFSSYQRALQTHVHSLLLHLNERVRRHRLNVNPVFVQTLTIITNDKGTDLAQYRAALERHLTQFHKTSA